MSVANPTMMEYGSAVLPRETEAAVTRPLTDVAGVVLAGSYHWTGGTFDEILPRPLLPIGERPIIEHVLAWMAEGGIETAILCANGSTNALRRHLQHSGPAAIQVLYREDGTPRGAAGCLKDAAELTTAATLVVSDGASLPITPLRAMVDQHRSSGASLTIAVHRTVVDDSAVDAPVGVYVFSRDVLDKVPATSFQDIKENLIPRLHREGHQIELFAVEEHGPRVFDASSYLAASGWYLERQAADLAAPHAWVDRDAVISGPVMLGAGVRVMAGAVIVGPTFIGAGTVVGAGAVVTRSVIWANVQIGERAFVDRSVLTSNAVVDPESAVTGIVRTAAQRQKSPWRPRLSWRKDDTTGILPNPALS